MVDRQLSGSHPPAYRLDADYAAGLTDRPDRTRVAIVDDNPTHARALMLQLTLDNSNHFDIETYDGLTGFLSEDASTPQVVFLDRYLPNSGLTEGRIREIRHRHDRCAVILHTGNMTPSLRATAAQEGAFTVLEKGLADAAALCDLVEAAASLRRVV